MRSVRVAARSRGSTKGAAAGRARRARCLARAAAYGLGGRQPTVTDANLVLGRLDPDDISRRGAATRRCTPPETPIRLAEEWPRGVENRPAVVDIANENVANAVRLDTIERGIDPREYTLVAYGGAGPLHACGVGDALGISRVIVPPHPGSARRSGPRSRSCASTGRGAIGGTADETG